MPRRTGHENEGRDWYRYLGDVSRVVVITTSVLAAIAAVLLLVLVVLRFLGVA